MVSAGLITRHADLIDMIEAADQQASRWLAVFEATGERPGVEEILAAHPEIENRQDAALRLLCEELCLRHDRGEHASRSGART